MYIYINIYITMSFSFDKTLSTQKRRISQRRTQRYGQISRSTSFFPDYHGIIDEYIPKSKNIPWICDNHWNHLNIARTVKHMSTRGGGGTSRCITLLFSTQPRYPDDKKYTCHTESRRSILL